MTIIKCETWACLCLVSLFSVSVNTFVVLSLCLSILFHYPSLDLSSHCLPRLSCFCVYSYFQYQVHILVWVSVCVCLCVRYFLFYFKGLLSRVCDVQFCFCLVSYDCFQLCTHASPLHLITLLCMYCLHVALFFVMSSLTAWPASGCQSVHQFCILSVVLSPLSHCYAFDVFLVCKH